MKGGPYSVILVSSVAHALRIERLLTDRGGRCRLVPVPRHLSSDCGVCVRFERADRALAVAAVAASRLEIEGLADLP